MSSKKNSRQASHLQQAAHMLIVVTAAMVAISLIQIITTGGGLGWSLMCAGSFACMVLALGMTPEESSTSQKDPADDASLKHEEAGSTNQSAKSSSAKSDERQTAVQESEQVATTTLTAPVTKAERQEAPNANVAADKETTLVAGGQKAANGDFSIQKLSERLTGSSDPIAELKLLVADIRTREDADTRPEHAEAPTTLELYCARVLEEAGLFAKDVDLPSFTIVRPEPSGMFYLRVDEPKMSYLAKLRILSLEAALNAVRFAQQAKTESGNASADLESLEEAYSINQRLAASICAQSPDIDNLVEPPEGEQRDSEWAVRRAISTAIESFQLPYRLETDWRCDVADGNVAIEFAATPEAVFAHTMLVDGIGLVASTKEMRRKAASDYALRLGLLLANAAFRASAKIAHVWVAATLDTANHHWCYLSVDFDRPRFARLHMADLGDLSRVYRSFVPAMRYDDAILRPVEQTFSLSEARFCPPRRYEPVSLSTRKIKAPLSSLLGCDHVSALGINEEDERLSVAIDIARHLDKTTEDNVRTVIDLTGEDPDPSVRDAGERVIKKFIDGTLSEDPSSVTEEFVAGDPLTRTTIAATNRLREQQDATGVIAMLEPMLAKIDANETYVDTFNVEWRRFGSYVDRALYNRLYKADSVALMLVPEAYFAAHAMLAVAYLMTGDSDKALPHARRAVELSPLDTASRINLVKCLEMQGRMQDAEDELNHLLSMAHDPQTIGIAYYRMAFFQWKKSNLMAAAACYACALRFLPQLAPLITMEAAALSAQLGNTLPEDLDAEHALETLRAHDIVVAPTSTIENVLYDCTRASVDAEIFPVARNFVSVLSAFSADDILTGILRSLEPEPDR